MCNSSLSWELALNVGPGETQWRQLLFAPKYSQATGCANGPEGVGSLLAWD